MNQLSNIKILEELSYNKELYDNVLRIMFDKSVADRNVSRYMQEIKYLRNILTKNNIPVDNIELNDIVINIKSIEVTNVEVQEYINSLKDNLLKQTELEKQKLIEQAEYLRLKENKELRESVNRLTSENSKLKRKLKRENNTK